MVKQIYLFDHWCFIISNRCCLGVFHKPKFIISKTSLYYDIGRDGVKTFIPEDL
jgi:hypothetical protein